MASATIDHRPVTIVADGRELYGDLSIPPQALGVVLFAHGSGSSRHSPRNRFVAQMLNEGRFATLLMDLLTADEERVDEVTAELRFDIPFLADRLVAATDWIKEEPGLRAFDVGYFGASTGAAAALVAAAMRPEIVRAIVSRGGRPDLAGPQVLQRVQAPTLLIVGERDPVVIDLNRRASAHMKATHRLVIVPRATHLFEEPGALDEVAGYALEWFTQHLSRKERS